jgi:nucleoside-diphosphate-sugar epimerase
MTVEERFLVTGAMGCLGAWVIRLLLQEGVPAVGLDLSTNSTRLRLICGDDELEQATLISGDISDPAVVLRAVADHGINRIVHCAALQVPFVRADPSRGARVNVLGTVNVLEAVKALPDQVRGIAYASSAAVFGAPERYENGHVNDDSPQHPEGTLYGVFKHTNELTARVYAAESGVKAVGLRPFVVYGPGRDQGMTSGPTVAILAAVAGVPYKVSFKGPMYFNFARDAAAAFIAAARYQATAPIVLNIPGRTANVEDIVEIIQEILPEARGTITVSELQLGSPSRVDSSRAASLLRLKDPIPLHDGIADTIAVFRQGLSRGILQRPAAAQ